MKRRARFFLFLLLFSHFSLFSLFSPKNNKNHRQHFKVIHHFATAKRRRALIASIGARLAPGGRALVTAWATPASQPEGKERKAASRWVPLLDESSGKGGGGRSGDFLVPWHEPPGWLKEKERREKRGGGGGGGGKGEAEEEEEEEGEEREGEPQQQQQQEQQEQQQKKTKTPKIIQQAPPVAWRFYHCYERDELASDAAAGAAAASAALRLLPPPRDSSSEQQQDQERQQERQRRKPCVVVKDIYLDKGNWCLELWRRV